MASVLRDSTFPLERRKEILRRFLPARDGRKPIRIEIEVNGGRGWPGALRRVTVRHLSIRKHDCQASVAAGAVTVEAGQRDGPGVGRGGRAADVGAGACAKRSGSGWGACRRERGCPQTA